LEEAVLPASAWGAFPVRGAFSAFSTPLNNIHATGVGIRHSGNEYVTGDFVLKMFVFDKLEPDKLPAGLEKEWNGLPVDVQALPVQRIRADPAPEGIPPQRERFDPIIGGVSISPLDAPYVGTLGCFVKRTAPGVSEELFALSNNHVLANVDTLPMGTQIVQPGPERGPTRQEDSFAKLHTAIPIHFPTGPMDTTKNHFDAALAIVTDLGRTKTGTMFGGIRYDPGQVMAPVPGQRVVKAGRTTEVRRGTITATNISGTMVNYGSQQAPRIAVFEDTITVVGDHGEPFSLPGDSGSIILDEATGHPVALLFAGDGTTTDGCNLGPLCAALQIWPV
jgi:hypothetical protein